MVKLREETDVFKIQAGYDSSKGSKFVHLFTKSSVFMNTGVSFKNYKMCTRGNQGQSKKETNIFENDENANTKRNNRTIVNSDYDSDNI